MELNTWESTSQAIETCQPSLMFLTRRRRMFMLFLSRVSPCMVLLFALSPSLPEASGQEKQTNAAFGYVSLTTAQAASRFDEPGAFAGGVVVRFYDEHTHRDSLVLTDEHGTALVPLRVGSFCAEAYGTDGHRLDLDLRHNGKASRCLRITPNQTVEFSLTLAHDVKYANTVPSLGVH